MNDKIWDDQYINDLLMRYNFNISCVILRVMSDNYDFFNDWLKEHNSLIEVFNLTKEQITHNSQLKITIQ